MAGILSFGAYIPLRRLQRSAIFEANRWFAPGLQGLANGERSLANWDEDSVTMAVEAARNCLGDFDRARVGGVILASTTFPFADRQNAGIVKEALNLSDAVTTLDLAGSQKAGSGALIQAFRSAVGLDWPLLVAASERPRARPASEEEMLNGDAAAAFLIGADDGLVKFIGSYSVSADFVDQFRAEGEPFAYAWESRWAHVEGYAKLAGAAIAGVLSATGVEAAEITSFIAGIRTRGAAAALASAAGIPARAVADHLSTSLGHAGCAHPLVMLAHTLEAARPGDKILLVGYGQGADALLLEATPQILQRRDTAGVSPGLARRRKETNYLRALALGGHLQLELGRRAEFEPRLALAALHRNRKTVFALVGGRCTRTGTVQFPRSQISVDQDDPSIGMQEDYPLADKNAHVLSYTADSLTYSPDPPCCYGMIEFDGGGRMTVEFTDLDPDQISVGSPMRMMFRIKGTDQRSGFVSYFWKAAPTARDG
jgi:3-hydroxy-3-methylglutaryl CoA synthase